MANSSSIQQIINLHARCSCWKKDHIFYFPCINFSSFLEVHLVKLVIISYIQCCEIILIQFHNCSKELIFGTFDHGYEYLHMIFGDGY